MGIVCKCVREVDKVISPAYSNKRSAALFLRNRLTDSREKYETTGIATALPLPVTYPNPKAAINILQSLYG